MVDVVLTVSLAIAVAISGAALIARVDQAPTAEPTATATATYPPWPTDASCPDALADCERARATDWARRQACEEGCGGTVTALARSIRGQQTEIAAAYATQTRAWSWVEWNGELAAACMAGRQTQEAYDEAHPCMMRVEASAILPLVLRRR
jgi:hypothetical protein